MAAVACVPAYFVLQLWALVRLHGGARLAAALPLVPAMPLLAWCAHAYREQSNLWPLPFILFAPFAAVYLAIILVANRRTRTG